MRYLHRCSMHFVPLFDHWRWSLQARWEQSAADTFVLSCLDSKHSTGPIVPAACLTSAEWGEGSQGLHFISVCRVPRWRLRTALIRQRHRRAWEHPPALHQQDRNHSNLGVLYPRRTRVWWTQAWAHFHAAKPCKLTTEAAAKLPKESSYLTGSTCPYQIRLC